MLEVNDLHVHYRTVHAVQGVTLSVAAGECVCLLGPNGAGKSSTIKAISGEVPFNGTVRFEGDDVSRESAESLARRGVIQVPEGRQLFRSLTVHENLLVAKAARGRRDEQFSEEQVYDLFPALKGLRNRKAWALSGGEQQMVAVGRGLVGSPKLLMLDEPSLGLAPLVTEVVFDAIAEIRKHVAVLLVEQNTALALEASDRGYVLSGGRVVMQGSAAELADDAKLLSSYLGQEDTLAEEEAFRGVATAHDDDTGPHDARGALGR